MNELGGGRGRAGAEIVLFAQQHAETTPGRIAGDAGAVDAASDDREIVNPGCHAAASPFHAVRHDVLCRRARAKHACGGSAMRMRRRTGRGTSCDLPWPHGIGALVPGHHFSAISKYFCGTAPPQSHRPRQTFLEINKQLILLIGTKYNQR
ncbi:protein of unknown function [Rhodovastum atsumiense]|nr:protein of unknown function [Rhodovastum atsumiense]